MVKPIYERPTMTELGSFTHLTRQFKRGWGWDHRRHRRRRGWCD